MSEVERLKYWLTEIYLAWCREGWEANPPLTEVMDSVNDVLANLGLDAEVNAPRVRELTKKWRSKSTRERFRPLESELADEVKKLREEADLLERAIATTFTRSELKRLALVTSALRRGEGGD